MTRPLHSSIPPKTGLGGLKGFMVCKPGIPHSIHQLGGEKGRTTIRIFPEVRNGQEVPFRLQEGDNQYTDWMCVYPAVAYAGLGDKFTCIATVKGHENEDSTSDYRGPIEIFFRTLRKAIKDQPVQFVEAGLGDWLKWPEFKGCLPAVTLHGFVQGCLFENKGKPLLAEDMRTPRPAWPVILMLKGTAFLHLMEQMNKETANYAGNPEDFNARYLHGDPIGTANGKYISFELHKATGIGQFGASYQATIGPKLPLDPAMVVSAWKPWDSLLHFLTEQEQFNLLRNHFPPEALDFVFAGTGFRAYLNSNELGKWGQQLANRQRMMVPQVPAGYAVPPQAAYPQGPAMPPGYVPPAVPPASAPAFVPPAPPPGFPTMPAAAPVPAAPAAPAIDFGGGFRQAGGAAVDEDEESAQLGKPTYPPEDETGADEPPFDGGVPITPAGAPIAQQASAPAAPAPVPVQPTGDPTTASSAAAAVRARLMEAQRRAAAAQQPPK